MKIQWTHLLTGGRRSPVVAGLSTLLIGGLGVLAPALAPAQTVDTTPLLVSGVSGNLHLHQSTPFGCQDLNGDIPVTGEWFAIAPAEGIDAGGGNRSFVLNQGTVRIHPFSVHVSCDGQSVDQDYTALAVEVAHVVPFEAVPSGPSAFSFSIPASDVLLYEAATVNGGSENGYKNPRDPVTGTIDYGAGTVSMHVVVAMKIHVDVLGDFDGDLTADLTGTIKLPDKDGDGVADVNDNCPLVPNADQSPVASPLVRAPGAATLNSCLATEIGRPVAVDLCFAGPVTVSNNAPHPYPLGSTVVTWSAVDSHSNVGSDTQTVTIVDTTPPAFSFVPPPVFMNNCGPANLGLPTATDDCGGTPTLTNNAPPKFFVGTTPVTWTATDISGNHATATQTVTVVDTVPPDVSCVPVSNGNNGFFQVFSSDACTAVPTIRIGGYVLTNGATIKIEEVGKSGVTLVNVMGGGIEHFHVGRGEAIITSTDGSGNVGSAACPMAH